MINKFLYRVFYNLNRITNSLKLHFKPDKNTDKSKDEKIAQNGLYQFELFQKSVYSPTMNCFEGLYPIIFEKEVYAFKSSNTKPLIIDCGANIGLGIIFWKKLFPEARIIAFEPSRKVFQALQQNMVEFEFTNVELINAALSDKDGEQDFTVNEDVSGSLMLEKDLGTIYKVKTVRLEPYLSQKIDFLKIDIEGAEVKILPQLVRHLHNIENIFIEYHSFVNQPQTLSSFLSVLEKHGFRYYLVGEYNHKAPLIANLENLKQDLQVGIWGKRVK